MNPMDLAKSSANAKGHDTKKFRLRTVSDEFEIIYDRYFQRRSSKVISWIQFVLAILVLLAICQILIHPSYGPRSLFTLGTPFGIAATFVAAGLTLAAANTLSYGKLHLAMTFHIINVVVNYLFVIMAVNHEFPRLRSERDMFLKLISANEKSNSSHEDSRLNSYYFYDYEENSQHTEYVRALRLIENGLKLTAAILTGMTLQTIFSFIMAIMTGRAICYGRSNLEGKFFEVEAVSGDHPEILSPVCKSAVEHEEHKIKTDANIEKFETTQPQSVEITRISSTPSPPPYEDEKSGFVNQSA